MQSKTLFQQNHETVLAANYVVDKIVERGAKRLYGKYLMTHVPHHLAHVQRKETENVIFQHVFPNDTGEKIDTLLVYWTEEEQPEQPVLDSWAALSLKAQFRAETEENQKKSHDSGSPRSMNLSNSIWSPRKRPGTAGGPSSMQFSAFSTLLDSMGPQKTQTQSAKARAKSARIKAPKEVFEILKAHDPEHDPEPDDPVTDQKRLEREIASKKRHDEAEIKRQIILQDQEREETRKLIDRRYYNREYTYEYDGKIMLIRPPDVETLPDTAIEPYVNTKKPVRVIREVAHVPKPLDAKGPATPKIYGSPNRFTKIQNTKTEFVYPKTPALQEILDPTMGVKLSMKGFQKIGPEIVRPNQMSKQEYLQIIEGKQEQQKEHYQRLTAEPGFVDHVLEDAIRKEEDKITRQLTEAYSQNQDSVVKEKKTPIKVYDQDKLVKLFAEIKVEDPAEKKEEQKRKARHEQKIMIQKMVQEEQKRAQEIHDLVSAYERNPEGEIVTKQTEERISVGLHRNVDEFNRKIALDMDWGRPVMTERKKTTESDDDSTQFLAYAQKRKVKPQTFEPHVLKEPRERQTVNQKLFVSTISQKDSRPQTANKPHTDLKAKTHSRGFTSDLKFIKSPRVLTEVRSTEDLKLPKKKVSIPNLPQIPISKLNTPRVHHLKSPSAMTAMTVKSTTVGTQMMTSPNEKSTSGFETGRTTERKGDGAMSSASRRNTKTEVVTFETAVRPQTQAAGKRFFKK